MNIKFHIAKTDYCSLPPATDRQKPSSGKASGDFDRVTINKPKSEVNDTEFARSLAHKTVGELDGKTKVSQERVLELQQQVASGTYKPDAERIAERLLGYR